jgi:hypothetical protein
MSFPIEIFIARRQNVDKRAAKKKNAIIFPFATENTHLETISAIVGYSHIPLCYFFVQIVYLYAEMALRMFTEF